MPALTIDIEAKFAKFADGLDQISRKATQAAGQMDKAFGALKGTLATVGATLSVGALTAFVKNSIDAADHLNDLSKKTGIAVETLGGLGFAAAQAGGSLDSMADATTKLNRSIAEAGAGNAEKAQAFKLLGINVRDAAGNLKSADLVMAELADRFESYADGPNKVAIAVKLLGKAGADQIPVLNEGGAKIRENIEYYKQYSGVTKDVADRADQFNDTLTKLSLLSGAFGTKVASELLGPLQTLADYILRAKEESKGFETASAGMRVVLETLAIVGANVAFVFRGIGTEIGGIAAQIALLQSASLKFLTGNLKGGIEDARQAMSVGKEMRADAAAARKELDEFEQRILRLGVYKPTAVDRDDAEAGRFNLSGLIKKRQAPALPDPGAQARIDAAKNAERALIETRSKIIVDAEKTSATERLAGLDHFYKEGFAGEERYWQVRGQIQKAAYEVERRALDENVNSRQAAVDEALKEKGKGSKEYYDALKDLSEAQARRNTLDAAFNAQGVTDVLARAKATQDYERAIKNVNIQLDEARGSTAAAAEAQFRLQNERLRAEARSRGDTEGQSQIDRLEAATAAQARFNELRERATQVTDRLALEEERIQNAQRVGAISEIEALRQTDSARKNALQTLGLTQSQLGEIARSSGLEKLRLDAERFGVSLETLASQSNLLGDRYRKVFEDAFGDEFAKVIDGTQRVSDAFKNMGKRIISELANIQARSIASGISGALQKAAGGGFSKLLEGIFGQSSGGGGAIAPGFDASGVFVGSFASGTDYVPRTGLALVHQGEKIIPAGTNQEAMVVHYAPVIDARGADVGAVARLEQALQQTRRDIVPIVRDAFRRGKN